jgi:hypothetical protein
MGHIFLSYAREDREYAGRIAHVREQAGHSGWWDRRIDGGEEFSAEIEAALSPPTAAIDGGDASRRAFSSASSAHRTTSLLAERTGTRHLQQAARTDLP